MTRVYRFLALSDHWTARNARRVYRAVVRFGIPAPIFLTRPALAVVVAIRTVYYFIARVFVCEPLFKAYCAHYGRNVRTSNFLHWVDGSGDLVIGNDVLIDGKCAFLFAVRYVERPSLTIGDHTGIGHNCAFTVGKSISIGRYCRIASSVQMFDTPGHPVNPEARRRGLPANFEDVRPIIISDNVWIGSNAIIYPGVTIGENSIVSMGSVVMTSVAANVVVAGNPARQVRSIGPTASL